MRKIKKLKKTTPAALESNKLTTIKQSPEELRQAREAVAVAKAQNKPVRILPMGYTYKRGY